MTNRERYINALTFRSVDKIPLTPGGGRISTRRRFEAEGMPPGANPVEYALEQNGIIIPKPLKPCPGVKVNFRMIPWFEEKVLEHKDAHYIVQDWMGNITEISDEYDYTYIRSAIDFVTRRWLDAPVHGEEDWEKMKERYNSATPERISLLSAEELKSFIERDEPYSISVSGPFWQLREWMGFEELCIAFIDRPEFVRSLINFWGDYTYDVFKRAFEAGIVPDRVAISEDMAYKAHAMISPEMTREFLLPVYLKWMSLFKKYNIPIIDMDSDGYIGELIPIWIEAGINVCDPIEVAAYNDIVAYRERFGKQIAYSGGIDKRAIAKGGRVIEEELKRVLPPLLRDGGFIPSCDHAVPADVPLENYLYYVKLLAKYTGWH